MSCWGVVGRCFGDWRPRYIVVMVTVSKLSHGDPPLWPNLAFVLFFLQMHGVRKVTAFPWLAEFPVTYLMLLVWIGRGKDRDWGWGTPWVGFISQPYCSTLPGSPTCPGIWRQHMQLMQCLKLTKYRPGNSGQWKEGSIYKIQSLPGRWLYVSPISTSIEVWVLGLEGEHHGRGR